MDVSEARMSLFGRRRRFLGMKSCYFGDFVSAGINDAHVLCYNPPPVNPPVKHHMIISPRSQWEEYICPDCDELMDDPVRTSCGHQMCYKCFDKRRSRSLFGPWCPVRDDDGQEHKMSWYRWSRDRTAEKGINKLLVECEKCKVKCTVKEYRNFNCSTTHKGIKSILISPRSQWEEYICPCCDELMNDPVRTSCGHRICCKCFYKRSLLFGSWCPVSDDDGQEHEMSEDDWSMDRTAEQEINNLIVNFDKYGIKCAMSVNNYRGLVNLSRKQVRKIVLKVLKKALPYAKRDLSIDEIRPLLYQNGVITDEEATELLGIFSGEEKITRLYTKMLPNKGLEGLEQYMRILYDTGWDTPSHMRHHGVLSINLSAELSRIMSADTILCQHEGIEAAREAIVPMVYSESLPDAVVNLGNRRSIDKLLPLMLKKHLVSISEYYWLTDQSYDSERLMELYTVILPQKGVEGLKGYMEVLQDVGRKIPKYRNHLDQLKSNLHSLLTMY